MKKCPICGKEAFSACIDGKFIVYNNSPFPDRPVVIKRCNECGFIATFDKNFLLSKDLIVQP